MTAWHSRSQMRIGAYRSGFTLVESGVALAVLSVAMLLVVQMGYWSLRHRIESSARFAATESLANILEQAQAIPWDSLTDDWSETLRIPDELTTQLPDAEFAVRIEQIDGRDLLKRVSVELRWRSVGDTTQQSVSLVGYYAQRAVARELGP